MARPLSIEVVSDVVCPWCFIGTKNLEHALAARPAVEARVVFRPFLLDTETPPEGEDLRGHLQRKFGADPEPMFRRVEGIARAAGLPLDFEKVRRMPNTLRAHTLLRNVEGADNPALARALFSAYFLDERDVADEATLVDLAGPFGLDAAHVHALVTSESELETTRHAALEQAARGIRGVPFFIFADRLAVSGAQPPEVLCAAIDRALGSPG